MPETLRGLRDRYAGCMMGLALGDALGAPYEGGPPGRELRAEPPLSPYTDDTEMAIGVAESLAARRGFDPQDMALRFIKNFNPARGYGWGTVSVISMLRQGVPYGTANKAVFPGGSFGNGAAMRVAPVGLFFHDSPEALKEAAIGSSMITHAHPLAVEGAFLIAKGVSLALKGSGGRDFIDALLGVANLKEYAERLRDTDMLLKHQPGNSDSGKSLGNTVEALSSVPTAIYAYALYGEDFLRTIRFCISLGGDTDTISAMAGALCGARLGLGGLPPRLIEGMEDGKRIIELALALYDARS